MQHFKTTPGWQLDATVTPTAQGHHLMLSRFLPSARRQEHQVRFSETLSVDELRRLRDALDQALQAQGTQVDVSRTVS